MSKTTVKLFSMIFCAILINACSKDDDGGGNITISTEIAIPDANFEQALIDLGFDTNGLNGNILKVDAEAVEELDISEKNIESLEGIQGFINLIDLDCDENQLTNLSLNGLTELETLYCSENQLTNLDISENIKLKNLECRGNQLTQLDVSNNGLLRDLYCPENELTSLDVSNNQALYYLSFSNNNISEVDFSNNPFLEILYCGYNQIETLDLSTNNELKGINARNNPLSFLDVKNGNNANMNFFVVVETPGNLCIQVDDPTYSSANWVDVDGGATFSLNCN